MGVRCVGMWVWPVWVCGCDLCGCMGVICGYVLGVGVTCVGGYV